METHVAVEPQPAEVDTSNLTLDSRAGVIQGLKDIAMSPKSKPVEKMRALMHIAQLKGFMLDRQIKDLRYVPTAELYELIRNLVIPTLQPFGVESGTPGMLIDAKPNAKPRADNRRKR